MQGVGAGGKGGGDQFYHHNKKPVNHTEGTFNIRINKRGVRNCSRFHNEKSTAASLPFALMPHRISELIGFYIAKPKSAKLRAVFFNPA